MSDAACPSCHSRRIKIIGSYETRDVMVIQCLDCGTQSAFDTENEQTDVGAVAPPPDRPGTA